MAVKLGNGLVLLRPQDTEEKCRSHMVPLTSPLTGDRTQQRSSFESFLDEYQLLRLGISAAGLLLMAIQVFLVGWDLRFIPIALVMVLVAAHASWCRLRHVRTPRTMLALDLTLWGWVMVLVADIPAIPTASFAFLAVLTVLFTTRAWTLALLIYLSGWHALSHFIAQGFGAESTGTYFSLLFTVGALVLVMLRVRGWLGRLDANRSQMLGVVSHELRNNLTGMIGMTEIVGSMDLAEAEMKELVGMAHHQAIDAAEIVEDLLTASRLESSSMKVQMGAVNVNAEVETTAHRFQSAGKDLAVQLAEDLPLARGDSLRVRQVLRNLLSNADRYGGPSVFIRTSLTGDGVQVEVGDDGDGVPLVDEGTIFLPYRRSTTAHRHNSSVGLGLWICRHLAEAMGGGLEYRRVEGMTYFVFSLPIDHVEPTAEEPSPVAAALGRLGAISEVGGQVSRGVTVAA